MFDIRSPSPWQVISELWNRGIIGESDKVSLIVCLSIANEIKLKTFFANCGQKELFSPLLQNPTLLSNPSNIPIFRNFDEDTLIRLLSTSSDIHRRCFEFCLKFVQQEKVDASILRNTPGSFSKTKLIMSLYIRLQNFSKASEWMKSISKNSPHYAGWVNAQGIYYNENVEFEKSIECFETALEYSQGTKLILQRPYFKMNRLIKKAKIKLEETMKSHDEIYGEGSETIISSRMMLDLGILFYELENMRSAILTLQKVEQRMTRCIDMDVTYLNLCMAMSLSKLCQNDQSLKYLDRALFLSHKILGEYNLSSELPKIYLRIPTVYGNCGLGMTRLCRGSKSFAICHAVLL